MTKNKEAWILYQTTNICNSKIYIGVHKLTNTSGSRQYLGSGKALKTAFAKYGRENFTRITLAEFSCAEEAYLAEAEMVTEKFINRPDTYNMCLGGRGGVGYIKGRIYTAETRAKLSAASKGNKSMLGKKHTEETKDKIRIANTGKEFSEQRKAKISSANKGRIVSEETKQKLSIAGKGNTRSLGVKHTEETKAKMSAAHKGRTHTDEAKAKIVAANIKPVVINGKYYPSAKIASEMEKVIYSTLIGRIGKSNSQWSEWRFATEAEIASFSAGEVEED
jgi:group I intron endonuclease